MSVFGDILNLGFGIHNNKVQRKNQDYQRALQETIFNREDTAVQRRMSDLQAAGINPYMASGQSAGAGAVVGSTAPYMDKQELNLGEILDYKLAYEQLKQAREMTRQSSVQTSILRSQATRERWAAEQSQFEREFWLNGDKPFIYGDIDLSKTNLFKRWSNDLNVQLMSNERLMKDLQFYDSNKFFQYLAPFIGPAANLFGSFMKYNMK